DNYSSPSLLASPQLELADDRTFLGKLATVPRMIESMEQRETLNKRTGAAAVDMETETIAEICAGHDVPMLSLRAISDTADEPFPAPAHVLFDLAKQKTNFVRLGSYLLTHPSAFGRLNAFQRSSPARSIKSCARIFFSRFAVRSARATSFATRTKRGPQGRGYRAGSTWTSTSAMRASVCLMASFT
ncbi:MAG: hypothetical protein DME70_11035, partial [Verrucomicrobia bacterium]